VLEIVPPDADHVTDVLTVPETVAENCCVLPAISETRVGVMEIPIGGGVVVTVTVALDDLVESAMLVAVTV